MLPNILQLKYSAIQTIQHLKNSTPLLLALSFTFIKHTLIQPCIVEKKFRFNLFGLDYTMNCIEFNNSI